MTDEELISEVIQREGGYVDHPDDSGGPTMWGITRGTLEKYRNRPVSPVEVEHLTINEAKVIYRQMYLIDTNVVMIKDDRLRSLVLDSVVNHGIGGGIRLLQSALGVKVDGILGPVTLEAIGFVDPKKLWLKMMGERLSLYGQIITNKPSQSVFARGWMNRMKGLLDSFAA